MKFHHNHLDFHVNLYKFLKNQKHPQAKRGWHASKDKHRSHPRGQYGPRPKHLGKGKAVGS